MTRWASRWIPLAALLVVVSSSPVCAQDPQTLVQEARDLYARGEDGQALAKLRQVLALDPSSDQAFDLLKVLEMREWIRIMIREGEHHAVVAELMKRARPAEKAKTADPEAIKALIARLDGDDWAERRKAMRELVVNHGEYVVPHLVPRLDSEDPDRRAYAMEWLRQLGVQAVLPLIQALELSGEMTRANAARVLGQIGDRRAWPYLLSLAVTGEESVAGAARWALGEMGMQGGPVDVAPAFLGLADAYYGRDVEVVDPFRGVYAVWAAQDDQLVAREVPRDVYHLKLAEEVLYDLLDMAPGNLDGRVLLASVLIAQAQAAQPTGSEGGRPEDVLAKASMLAAVEGADVLDGVVRKALADGRPAVASGAVELLGSMLDPDTFRAPNGLTDALASSYKRVRFRAAIQIARVGPAEDFPGRGQVVPTLAECLGQTAVRTVLVIDDVMETRERVISALNDRGYFAYGATSGALGLARVRDYPIEDACIIRYDLQDRSVSQVVKELRDDPRTADVPIALLCAPSDVGDAKTNYADRVQLFIQAPAADADAWEPELREKLPELDRAREEATMLAATAAGLLAHMDPRRQGFSAAGAVDALIGVLQRDDRVRTPALDALGAVGDAAALAPVLDVFRDATASESVRGHAAFSLARISRANGTIAPEARDMLESAILGEGGDDYMRMLGKAAGIAPLEPAQRAELLGSLRSRITIDMME